MRHVGAQHQSGGGRRADRRYDSALALGSFIAVLSLGLGFVALPQQSAVADDSVEPASTVLESVQSGQGAASPGQSRSVDTGAEGSSASDQSGDGVGAVEAAQSEEGSSSASSQAGEEERPIPLLQPRSSHSSLAAAPFGLRDSLSCEAGDYYTISNEGQVYKVSSAGGVPDPRTTFAWDFSQKSDKSKHYNGLAIGAEGETAYAFNRKAGKSGDRLGIVRWNSGGGVPKQVYLGHLPKIEGLVDYKGNSVSGVALGNMVAGGVSPTDPDGEFYFGGFFYFKPYDKASGNYTYFHLLKYSPSTGNVSTVGYVNIRKDKASQNNGDIAFSAAGDLFILWNDGKGRTKIVPVLRRDLQDAAGGEIYASGETSEQDTDQGQYNGLAFDAEGNLFVQYSDGGTFNYSIDPDTGREIEGSLTQLENIAKGNGSDLASCANPSTLFLVKDLVARERPSDQFQISVTGKDSTVLATDQTEGTNTGEAASAGIFVVKKDRWYTLKEQPLNGADPSQYKTTLSCVDTYTDAPIPDDNFEWDPANPMTARVFIAKGDSRDIVCTFKNEPKPKVGSVTWSKVSSVTGKALAGSVWEIRPSDGSAPIAVTDNTGQPGYSGRDTDPAVGAFKVEDLPIGRYTLHETTAPPGHVPGSDKSFEINADSLSAPKALGPVKNTPIMGKVTWRKTDVKGQPIGGSVWTLTPTDPAGQAKTITDCTGAPCPAGGDQDPKPGQFRLDSVAFGKYTLTEKTPPTGYIKSDEVKNIEVKDNGATVDAGAIKNKRLPQVSWTKVEDHAAGALLGGSVWTWRPTNPAGSAFDVVDCVADSAAECTGNDADPAAGKFLLKNVSPGQYTLTEKIAPEGYQLDKTVHQVSVKDKDADTTKELGPFINLKLKGAVIWSKVDADNDKALGGSEWTLTGPGVPHGTVIADCDKPVCPAGAFTDQDPAPGGFKILDLQVSDKDYTLTEAKAPAGYVLDTTPHTFRIEDASGYTFGEAFKNAKTTVPGLPLTGGMSADSFLLAGGAFLLVAGTAATIIRKKKARA